jgi:lysophospholipase L1-like esterase
MACVLLTGVTGVPGAAAAAAGTAPHWVASWAASPSDEVWPVDPTFDPIPIVLVGQTIRDVITPHLGGSELRIHLSNRFGTAPTTFGHVTVGLRTSGAGVSSTKNVTFGGSPSVRVPAGVDVVSDPVSLTFSAFTPLALSLYVPGIQSTITKHWNANATSYYTGILSGDATTQLGGRSYSNPMVSWFYLDGLDVEAPPTTSAIVAFGDSITDGWVSGSVASLPANTTQDDGNGRYPDDLQRRLDSDRFPLSVVNAGISSNGLVSSTPLTGPTGVSRLKLDALNQAGVAGIILLEGINDLSATSSGAKPAKLESGYTNAIRQVHAAGLKIWLGTILPASNSIVDGVLVTPSSEIYRQEVNQWIRAQKLSDGVIDFDAALRNPADPSQLAPQYSSIDHLHPNLAGYQAMANAVPLSLLTRSTVLAP